MRWFKKIKDCIKGRSYNIVNIIAMILTAIFVVVVASAAVWVFFTVICNSDYDNSSSENYQSSHLYSSTERFDNAYDAISFRDKDVKHLTKIKELYTEGDNIAYIFCTSSDTLICYELDIDSEGMMLVRCINKLTPKDKVNADGEDNIFSLKTTVTEDNSFRFKSLYKGLNDDSNPKMVYGVTSDKGIKTIYVNGKLLDVESFELQEGTYYLWWTTLEDYEHGMEVY